MTAKSSHLPLGASRAHIKSLLPALVPSEQRVARLCLDSPETVALMSVQDLVVQTGTSPATVVRACKALGFEGFQHLRQVLLRDLGAAARDEADIQTLPLTDDTGSNAQLVSSIFARATHDIRGSLGSLDFKAFDAAVDLLRNARRILVLANGASLAPAQSLALNFLGSGIICEAPLDAVGQHINATLLTSDDVCIAISDSGENSYTVKYARLAAQHGASVIGVTSYGKSELARLSRHTLVAGAEFHAWNDQLSIGNVVQMLILKALHTAVVGASESGARANPAVQEQVMHIVDNNQ